MGSECFMASWIMSMVFPFIFHIYAHHKACLHHMLFMSLILSRQRTRKNHKTLHSAYILSCVFFFFTLSSIHFLRTHFVTSFLYFTRHQSTLKSCIILEGPLCNVVRFVHKFCHEKQMLEILVCVSRLFLNYAFENANEFEACSLSLAEHTYLQS